MKKCAAADCRKRVKAGKYCPRCQSRRYKARRPWRYAFNYHKQNARRRLDYLPRAERWLLSFEEFVEIWNREPDKKAAKDKVLRGVSPVCPWEIDRIDSGQGYKAGNVRLVSKRVNTQLYYAFKRGELEGDAWLSVQIQTAEQIEASLEEIRKNVPF